MSPSAIYAALFGGETITVATTASAFKGFNLMKVFFMI